MSLYIKLRTAIKQNQWLYAGYKIVSSKELRQGFWDARTSLKTKKQMFRELSLLKHYWGCIPLHYFRYKLYAQNLSDEELKDFIPPYFFYVKYCGKIFKDIDNEKILLNVKKSMTGYDYGKILQKIENEIKLINNNIDQMYVDKLNNKISEEMYERLFSKLKNEIKQKENEYIEIKRQKEESKKDDTEKIKSIIREFLSLNKPTPEIMKIIINRIEIHQDKQVDLYFNFKQLNNLKEKI